MLWLIDAKERRVSVYKSEGGKNIVWVAARDFSYDFKVESYKDESDFSMPQIRDQWMKSGKNRRLEGTGSKDLKRSSDSDGRPDDSGRDREEDGDK